MWIPEFINFCEENRVPVDFITTHHYPADESTWRTGDFSLESLMKKILQGSNATYGKDIMYLMTKKAHEQAGNLPLYYTEWNTSSVLGDKRHDSIYSSAYVAKILADNDGLVTGYSYWTFSDIFEECGQLPGAFHGGFGLMNYYGIPKPVYRCFELYHGLGQERVGLEITGTSENIGAIATRDSEKIRIIIYNFDTFDKDVSTETLDLILPDELKNKEILIKRIDETHANATRKWEIMGAEEYLNSDLVERLMCESELQVEVLKNLTIEIPPYGVCAVDIIL